MNPAEVERRRVEARVHLDFVIQLCEEHLSRGARFLHEHPASAASWNDPGMKKLLERPGVHSGIGHMCRFGMRTGPPHGGASPLL
eukprot:10159526-Alexandrium_andersonii.AAC.1